MVCCEDTASEDGNNENVKVRGCTDLLWLIIYILFWILMIFIAGFALVYGNPIRLIHGYDSFGNTCGSIYNDNFSGKNISLSGINTANKRFLFFLDIAKLRNSLQVCVEKCPDRNINSMRELQEFYNETGSNLCRYDFDLEGYKGSPHNLSENGTIVSSLGPCPPLPIYKSVPVLNRCVPEPLTSVMRALGREVYATLNSWDLGEQVLSDVFAAWRQIAALTLLSLVLSLIIVSLFYLVASFVANVILVAASVVSIATSCYLWVTYFQLKAQLDRTSSDQLLDEVVHNEKTFFVYSIIVTIFTIVILLLVLVMRKRVDFVATLFKEAADCLAALPTLYLQPVFSFIQLIIFYAFWLLVIVCLFTANYPGTKTLRPFSSEAVIEAIQNSENKTSNDQALPAAKNISAASFTAFTLVQFSEATWVRYMWWVYFIGLIWTSEFILACQQMVIAGAVARWYFVKDKSESKPPVWTAFRHLVSYHLGTIALGSLLITIFKVPRLILSYVAAKLKNNEQSSIAKCISKCCICCLYCFETCIRFVNHNAYTVVAMQGINFCPAASRAWYVLVNNALRLGMLNSVGDFILFLGKLLVMLVTGCVALFVFKQDPDLHLYAAPTLVTCVFAYFVAHSVISLYEVVIDTLFLCVCEDQHLNGEEGKWRHMAISNLSAARDPSEGQPMNM